MMAIFERSRASSLKLLKPVIYLIVPSGDLSSQVTFRGVDTAPRVSDVLATIGEGRDEPVLVVAIGALVSPPTISQQIFQL